MQCLFDLACVRVRQCVCVCAHNVYYINNTRIFSCTYIEYIGNHHSQMIAMNVKHTSNASV